MGLPSVVKVVVLVVWTRTSYIHAICYNYNTTNSRVDMLLTGTNLSKTCQLSDIRNRNSPLEADAEVSFPCSNWEWSSSNWWSTIESLEWIHHSQGEWVLGFFSPFHHTHPPKTRISVFLSFFLPFPFIASLFPPQASLNQQCYAPGDLVTLRMAVIGKFWKLSPRV